MDSFLSHLRNLVQEIILVDTGSTDQTIEIAKKHGAKVYSQKWTGDFSKARNLSIQKATQPWILILDPDERIATLDQVLLRNLIQQKPLPMAYSITTRNYSEALMDAAFKVSKGEYEEERSYPGYIESKKVRLFQNFKGIHFVGVVHELLEPSIRGEIKDASFPIHHYGGTQAVFKDKNKAELYESLAEQKVVTHSNHWKAHYELGITKHERAKYSEALKAYEKALQLKTDLPDLWSSLALCYLDSGNLERAENCLKEAYQKFPEDSQVLYNLALLEIRRNQIQNAVNYLLKLLKLHPSSFAGFRMLGLCFMAAGNLKPATECFREALRICPQFFDAAMDLTTSLMAQGEFVAAERSLEEAKKLRPDDQRLLHLCAELSSQISSSKNT